MHEQSLVDEQKNSRRAELGETVQGSKDALKTNFMKTSACEI